MVPTFLCAHVSLCLIAAAPTTVISNDRLSEGVKIQTKLDVHRLPMYILYFHFKLGGRVGLGLDSCTQWYAGTMVRGHNGMRAQWYAGSMHWVFNFDTTLCGHNDTCADRVFNALSTICEHNDTFSHRVVKARFDGTWAQSHVGTMIRGHNGTWAQRYMGT